MHESETPVEQPAAPQLETLTVRIDCDTSAVGRELRRIASILIEAAEKIEADPRKAGG